MRLTLRTLLAYLDDTLEPAQAKLIGQKVAESDAAQELIARIKQVTRRRRLTTPPASDSKSDPNTIAEYLDNELSSERTVEIEELCMGSDVHLAEVAACHQILTLFEGQPALVPPTARQRMYGLVKGREAIPYRKPAPAPAPSERPEIWDEEEDEALLLGLPLYRWGKTGPGWLMPVGAVLLLGATLLCLFLALRGLSPDVAVAPPLPDEAIAQAPAAEGQKAPAEAAPVGAAESKVPPPAVAPPGEIPAPVATPPVPLPVQTAPRQPAPPGKERREVGRYMARPGETSSILLQRASDNGPWERLKPESPLFTGSRLLSLPGYRSELRLDSGVKLVLWGNLPELSPAPIPIYESAVILHANAQADLDLSLERGRVALYNSRPNGPVKVVLRCGGEVWELTLDDDQTEMAVDLRGLVNPYTRTAGLEPPTTAVALHTLAGSGHLKIRDQEFALTSPTVFIWDDSGGPPTGVQRLPQVPRWRTAGLPSSAEARPNLSALEELERLLGKAPVDVALIEAVKVRDPALRSLAVHCLAALDDLPRLLDALDDAQSPPTRQSAVRALKHFLGSSPNAAQRLRDVLVTQKGYRKELAETLLQLLHGFGETDWADPNLRLILVEYLRHDQLPIRQLAWELLRSQVPEGRKINYDPAGDSAQRSAAVEQWRKVLQEPRSQVRPGGR